ncbi:DHA2 family metal-tetracycline-proton antiporter-like MFS transporter [Evansella vedderi]|uniref:Tetracycline resistance protein n=1 Tax=Evansella vedderi TaxID=38282 RepID=A0ABT9ZVP3_9BACI|nr:MFS transporter [Evansella vedderi]MDQ0255314.1 DHA2 family metal-tetracycline-proton antiporter-like MFS transporter [Evansella vedderi]
MTETSSPTLKQAQKNKLTLLLCIILTFTVMNGTMFNVAIPDIAEEFGLLPSEVSWVMTGYILVFAIGSLMYGKLADIYPIKTLLTIGIILFASGAALGFLSQSYPMLLAARTLQAMGGATIPALSFIIPARFMPNERGKVFGIVASTVAFASGAGPIAGGVVGGALDWRFLFIFSILSLIAIPFLRKWLPNEEKRDGKVDIVGAVLIALSITGLLLFITDGSLYALVFAIVTALLFGWRTVTYEQPFIQPSMLKNRYYTSAIITSFLGTVAMFGMIFVIPIMARDLYSLSTVQIGLLLFPGAMAAGIIGQFGGKLIDRKGSYPVTRIGFTLVIIGTILISTFTGFPPWIIALCILVQYIAFPLIQSSTANLLTIIIPKEKTGVGIGLFNLLNFLAGAISSAVFGSILDLSNVSTLLNPLAQNGENTIYANLFIGLALLSITALLFFSFIFKGFENNKGK